MSTLSNKEKVKQYEALLHRMQLYVVTGDNDKLSDLLGNICNWSYAHRAGNGELSEDEVDARIESAFNKLLDTKK